MRVLAVRPGPAFAVNDVYRGYLKAFRRLGCEVADFNYDDRLTFYEKALPDGTDVREAIKLAAKGISATCYEWWPDVVVFVSGFYTPPAYYGLLKNRGHKVVLIHTESPYEDSKQVEVAGDVSLNVVNDPTNLDQFLAVNPESIYLPHCYDPELHTPFGPVAQSSDVCFVGTGFADRIRTLEQVDWSGLDVTLAGNWQQLSPDSPLRPFVAHGLEDCVDNQEAVRLYRGTKASLNLYRRDTLPGDSSEGWSMGPREVELAATGCFYLTEARGENREVLPMVPTFNGAGELSDQLRWWLANPTARDVTARKARVAVADRTFENNARKLLTKVG